MTTLQEHFAKSPRRSRGLTLIELLVGMALSMVVVAAASYVFLNTRTADRATNEAAALDETAAFAMTAVGRTIQNARFYPVISSEVDGTGTAVTKTVQPFPSIKTKVAAGVTSPVPAYQYGIFGCEGQYFDHVDHTCKAWADGSSVDTIVVSYYTNDNLQPNSTSSSKPLDIGHRADCTRSDVVNDPINTPRVNTALPALAPLKPLFVSNAYTAVPTIEVNSSGATVNTLSLACSGNGGVGAATTFGAGLRQPLISGLQDLQITYGVSLTTSTTFAERYYTAAEVAALPNLTVADTVTAGTTSLSPWGLVRTVKVCMVAKTVGDRVSAQSGVARSYVNCNDQTVAIPATDGSLYRRYVQTFGIRNNLNLSAARS